MSIPDYQTFFLPVLKLANTGEIKTSDAVNSLSEQFNLSDEEKQEMIPSGGTTIVKNRVNWSIVYLFKAELLIRPKRGYFTITDRGKEVLSKNPDKISNKLLRQFPEFIKFQRPKKKDKDEISKVTNETTETPEERIGLAYQEITDEMKSQILSKVLESSPEFFERLIIKLLVAMGYGGSGIEYGKHLGKSGDGGVDGLINEDELGLDIIYIQAKRYSPGNPIGRPEIQKFAGSLIGIGANKGVFVTTSSFSSHANEYAKNVPQRIILVDGEMLSSLMLQHNVGVRLDQAIELKKIDEDFFLD